MTDAERKALVEALRGDWPEILVEKHWMMDSDAIDKQRTEAADQIEADGQRIAELEREVERRTYDGIHTCHDQCQRVACVLRRRIAELEGLLREAEVKLTDVQGAYAAKQFSANLLIRIRAALGGKYD